MRTISVQYQAVDEFIVEYPGTMSPREYDIIREPDRYSSYETAHGVGVYTCAKRGGGEFRIIKITKVVVVGEAQ